MIDLAAIALLLRPNHHQRLKDLINHAAKRKGDKEEHLARVNYWTDVVNRINPHTHWNEFANAKQAQHDALIELDVAHAECERAMQEARNYIIQTGGNDNEVF